MTQDRDFKRLVRHRMRKTGESYVSARVHLRRAQAAGRVASEHSGEPAMYPFEKFTDPAKRALTRAQFEAEVGNSRSIATTHLLLGLLDDKESMAMALLFRLAPNVLRGLLHDKAGFREAFQRQPAERPVQGSEGLVPSEEVKRALELAFAEAQLVGDGTVGTGHLFVGMLQASRSMERGQSFGSWLRRGWYGRQAQSASRPIATSRSGWRRPRSSPEAKGRRRSASTTSFAPRPGAGRRRSCWDGWESTYRPRWPRYRRPGAADGG